VATHGGHSSKTFSVNYSSTYNDYGSTTSLTRNQTVLLQLQLRTLGDAKVSDTFLNTTALDGVKY
jgi:LPS-assembly protein